MNRSINAHEINDRAMLIRAKRHAHYIQSQPLLVSKAKEWLTEELTSHRRTSGQRLWKFLLERPLDQILELMVEESPRGRLRRSNNPFSLLMTLEDEATRRETWRQAKDELSTNPT